MHLASPSKTFNEVDKRMGFKAFIDPSGIICLIDIRHADIITSYSLFSENFTINPITGLKESNIK